MLYILNIDNIDKILQTTHREKQLNAIRALGKRPTAAFVVDNKRPIFDYADGMEILEPLCEGFILTVQDSFAEGEGDERLSLDEYAKKFKKCVQNVAPAAKGKRVIHEIANEANLPMPYQSPDIHLKAAECQRIAPELGAETAITYFYGEPISAWSGTRAIGATWAMGSIYIERLRHLRDMDYAIPTWASKLLVETKAKSFAIREYGENELKDDHGEWSIKQLIKKFESMKTNGAGYWNFQKKVVPNTRLQTAQREAWKARSQT